MTRGWDLTPARNLGQRPEIIRALRSDVTDYGNNAIQLRKPRPRKRGALTEQEIAQDYQQVPAAPGGGARGRIWPFRAGVSVANARTCIVSPQFAGPAVLQRMVSVIGSAVVTGANFAMFWAPDGEGQGQNLASDFRPGGTAIFSPITFLTPANTDPDTQREHYDHTAAGVTAASMEEIELHYVVDQEGPFFLKLNLRNGGAGTFDMKGHVALIEGVSLDRIADYL